MSQQVHIVPGRSCDSCTMCCKLLSVAELEKPPVSWCSLCDVKAGCNDYARRPTECRQFYCQYLLDPTLDDRWKPSRCKLVVTREEPLGELLIHNDPSRPDAWRKEPFYSQIVSWALAAGAEGRKLAVWQGNAKIVVSSTTQGA